MRIIAHAKYNDHTDPIFEKFRILKFDDIYKYKIAKYMYELNNKSYPVVLSDGTQKITLCVIYQKIA